MRKIFIYAMWGFVFICIAAVAIVFTAIAKGKIGYVPPVEELENPNLKFATQVISEDGKLLGTWSLSKETACMWAMKTFLPSGTCLGGH